MNDLDPDTVERLRHIAFHNHMMVNELLINLLDSFEDEHSPEK